MKIQLQIWQGFSAEEQCLWNSKYTTVTMFKVMKEHISAVVWIVSNRRLWYRYKDTSSF